MNFPLFLLPLFFLQDGVPFKAKEEFEVKLEFQFKPRPGADPTTVYLGETTVRNNRSQSGPLPYLFLNIEITSVNPEEVRMRVVSNQNNSVATKKLDKSPLVRLDLGFTDDIKGRVSAHEYTVLLLSKDKKPLSRIFITFEEDGTYLVNGERRGKI